MLVALVLLLAVISLFFFFFSRRNHSERGMQIPDRVSEGREVRQTAPVE